MIIQDTIPPPRTSGPKTIVYPFTTWVASWWRCLTQPGIALDLFMRGETPGFTRRTVAFTAVAYAIYGLTMGAFRGTIPAFVSGIKLPILFLLTLAISLPALYVLNVLFGPRLDLRTCVRLLALAVSVNAAALASYIPFSALFTLSASRGDYHSLVMMHFIAFSLASLASMAVVAMLFRAAAQARGVRWRPLFVGVWLFLYAFIGLKMVWILRPWIGDWDREYTALRDIRGSIYGSLYRMITQTEEIYIELPSPSTQENRP